ncbi:hypothetical protein DFH09DRAFT_1073136 [Mycena vulgaris]|nr:hypothetical protein DFH09DRAFT_1073136 [Mycena vulgaris]
MCDAMRWTEGGFQRSKEHVVTTAQLVRMDTFSGPQVQDTQKWAQFVEERLRKCKDPDPGKKEMDEQIPNSSIPSSSAAPPLPTIPLSLCHAPVTPRPLIPPPPNERTTELNGKERPAAVLHRLYGLCLGVTERAASRPDISLIWRSQYVGKSDLQDFTHPAEFNPPTIRVLEILWIADNKECLQLILALRIDAEIPR